MKRIRTTPNALNESLDILGVQRYLFIGILLGCGLLAMNGRPHWGAGLFFALNGIIQAVKRMDADWFQILPACFRFQLDRAYDPCEREYFQLVITEDSSEAEDR